MLGSIVKKGAVVTSSCPFSLMTRKALCQSSWCPEELLPYIEGRGRQERKDSVTLEILKQRKRHREKMDSITVDSGEVRRIESEGFGSKQRLFAAYNFSNNFVTITEDNQDFVDKKSMVGAGGHAIHLGSASADWPIFKHLLPEIAFAGHSNSGKSTLVNSLVGVLPKTGPAKVSDRAGWTDQICFYQLGRKPPILTLADLPGYGHAVASANDKKVWTSMMKDFLKNRRVLSMCCILVDSTRGLCSQDKVLLRWLHKEKRPWIIVLTKADLLSAEDILKSATIVDNEISAFKPKRANIQVADKEVGKKQEEEEEEEKDSTIATFRYGDMTNLIWPVSSSTGAGINNLWHRIRKAAEDDSTPFINERSVREHRQADSERRRPAIEKKLPTAALKLSNRVRRKIN